MKPNEALKTSRAEAEASGASKWLDLDGCPECPAPGPKARYLTGNVCVGCLFRDVDMTLRLFRQGMPGAPDPFPLSAIEAESLGVGYFYGGDRFSGIVCSHGPHLRKTSLETGRCLTCREEKGGDGRQTPTTRFAAENPDFIVDKEGARLLGLTQYRTGRPCGRGHTGWRHVASGACVECRREN